ncbi:MAG: hypothetical protein ACPGPF_11285, partial [Pontibacterium sp.]
PQQNFSKKPTSTGLTDSNAQKTPNKNLFFMWITCFFVYSINPLLQHWWLRFHVDTGSCGYWALCFHTAMCLWKQ